VCVCVCVYLYSDDNVEGPRVPAVKLTACRCRCRRRCRRRCRCVGVFLGVDEDVDGVHSILYTHITGDGFRRNGSVGNLCVLLKGSEQPVCMYVCVCVCV